ITVVPIDRQQARQQLRQQFAWLSDSFVVVFFGFLHPVKGIEYLLSAFRQVVTQQPQARLLLLGGVESLALQAEAAKSYWDRLQLLVKELYLSDRVSMTGYVSGETASHYLSGADLGVLPFNHGVTLKSGSLLALMAHGLPVIATRSTPPDPDLLAENLLELIPTRNDTALTEALLKLIPDRAKCDRLSATASTLSDRFTWSAIAKAHNNIYQQLLTTKKQNSK
ncbi:glycosyltransferase family 4 protein, partial [Chroococcidiopsidales cyanobacterium LEGE 13417]|nr:glycosyltransferase family 4 protein [Chroococcidiopsidales cyanobacterium LEGE 13417]